MNVDSLQHGSPPSTFAQLGDVGVHISIDEYVTGFVMDPERSADARGGQARPRIEQARRGRRRC
jgi:hypothetical protein